LRNNDEIEFFWRKKMRVILKSDVANLGQQGDVKEVSSGFARNYLIPQNLVVEATFQNFEILKREKMRFMKKNQEIIDIARKIALKIEATEFLVKVKVGENGKIFGSVTTTNLSKIFRENGFKVNKHDILISNSIKELGNYEVNVKLHPEVVVKVKISVINEIA
jgi:large subunit ribosomal protein L9